jgi:hypothetical protein
MCGFGVTRAQHHVAQRRHGTHTAGTRPARSVLFCNIISGYLYGLITMYVPAFVVHTVLAIDALIHCARQTYEINVVGPSLQYYDSGGVYRIIYMYIYVHRGSLRRRRRNGPVDAKTSNTS